MSGHRWKRVDGGKWITKRERASVKREEEGARIYRLMDRWKREAR